MIGFAIGAQFTITGLDRAHLENVFNLLGSAFMEAQKSDPEVLDHSVSIDLGKGKVEINVTTSGATRAQAEALAERTIAEVLRRSGARDVESVMSSMRPGIHDAGIEITDREEVLV